MSNLGLIFSAVLTVIAGIAVAVVTVRNWRAAGRGEELPFTGYTLAVVLWTLTLAIACRRSYEAACYAALLGGWLAASEWQSRHLE